MSRTPAPHVEPFHSSGRERPILLMEQDELLLGSDRSVLQHPLQLQCQKNGGVRYLLLQLQFNRTLYCEIHIYVSMCTHTHIPV